MLQLNEKVNLREDKTIDVTAVGEILIDMISTEYSDDLNCKSFEKFFGGSPGNLAINVKNLGAKSSLISKVGNDDFGRFLVDKLNENGVDTSGIEFDDDSNTSMVIVNKSKTTPKFIAYRDAEKKITYNETIDKLIKDTKIIHFSSWPISYSTSRNTIEKIIEVAKDEGALICFDPNYRKILWEKGHDGASYVKAIIEKVDIIKPSYDDAFHLFGEGTVEVYIDKFLELGPKLVIMTLGKYGLIVANKKECMKFSSLATEVVDTTGAGDAFWSGFYLGILNNKTIKESVELGLATSAYKLKHMGAVIELPHFTQIEKIYSL
ncbi:fructokinase [Caloranaerobacter sp. TR13]|uniref:carbohydrate kinase family protein n=1 Tax=Caloranaerobacter sp. TR13 TaxID=1302151 RepID=UPI0006D44984|nr:carbohydrate kinase [Caloranaerobacter sp. TR13]KPU27258.1 fructokinase [Caloranaerobacter sp. TR13]